MAKMNIYYENAVEELERVKEKIREHMATVDRESKAAAEKIKRIRETYLPEAATKHERLVMQSARAEAAASAEVINTVVQYGFDSILERIGNFIRRPISSEFQVIMASVRENGVTLDPAEIRILSESAQESYFASKILAETAKSQGLRYPFLSAQQILADVEAARREVKTVLQAYPGETEGNTLKTPWISQINDGIKQGNAKTFLDREATVLTKLESDLRLFADPSVKLFASDDVSGLDRFFEGAETEEDKTERMKNLLLSRPDLESQLSIYQPEIFKAAKKVILDERLAEAQEAKQAVQAALEAAKAANQAARAAKTAEIESQLKQESDLRRTAAAQANNNALR